MSARPSGWAVYHRGAKGWRPMLLTIRQTRLLARSAFLGDATGQQRQRMSDALERAELFKVAPIMVQMKPGYRTTAERRREEAKQRRAGQ